MTIQKNPGSSGSLEGITVLVVEDNMVLLMAIRRFLEAAGCAVLEAGAPAEAITVAREQAGRIDAALIDLILPEMSGPECADLLREDRPDLAVAYMSGYAETVSAGRPGDDTPVLLAKPFARDELIETIRELVNMGTPPAG